MTANPPKPKGLVPHLVIDGAAKAIEFYSKAFGATEMFRMPAQDGKRIMHAELKIDEGTLYLADDFPEYCGGASRAPKGPTPVTLHQYMADVDASTKRAEAAGAKVVMPPTDMFWGDRYAQVQDPFGHSWSLATPLPAKS
jgi:PhnB protein